MIPTYNPSNTATMVHCLRPSSPTDADTAVRLGSVGSSFFVLANPSPDAGCSASQSDPSKLRTLLYAAVLPILSAIPVISGSGLVAHGYSRCFRRSSTSRITTMKQRTVVGVGVECPILIDWTRRRCVDYFPHNNRNIQVPAQRTVSSMTSQ